ncbi:MAG: M24 family metallopeptidase [Candidatus Obscuribacterales bacterium]|nr:M24 family metallopeptidase [Candidatus Obscuribacterales bacterium]
MKPDIAAIQKALAQENVDAWLFYYFHENDPLALRILNLDDKHFFSRRWFYLIPKSGAARKLVHRIESDSLDSLPGEKQIYVGWRQLEEELPKLLDGCKTVAMQYSPRNAVPYISRVDAGTLELVRSCGAEVVTAADLVSRFEATWTDEQLKSHVKACENLKSIVFEAFQKIRDAIAAGAAINEYQVQEFIWQRFEALGMSSNSRPIVAVNGHSGSPHYQPDEKNFAAINDGDFVLIDLWAKLKEPQNAVYADITWTGFVGKSVPQKYIDIFKVVSGGRDAALSLVKERVGKGETLYGWEVDEAARAFISAAGYGQYFIHRTGHSIGLEVHANGANMDNLETREERRVLPNTCFSIEPGVYLEEFGIRSEIDVFVGEGNVIVAAEPIQDHVIPIMSLN